MKVAIACGGTGGHLFPGLAVAEALLERRHQVRLLVSEKAVDHAALAAWTGNSALSGPCGVQSVPAVGYGGWRQLTRFCIRLAKATRSCAAICNEFQPDAVIGMGGFTSAPAVMAARWFGARRAATLIHESNAVPGKANRWVGRFVDHVAVGLPDCARFFAKRPVTVTGTPIRSALRAGSKRADAHERLGLERGRLTVLVVGGSQGAQALNAAVTAALSLMWEWRDRIQFMHLTGARDEQSAREAYRANGFKAVVMSFCNEMELAYSAADVAVARSGAGTLTELSAFGLPAILVPYPNAAGDHQWHNARQFERAGAAMLLEQSALSELPATLAGLLSDEGRRRRLADAMRALAVSDAAERIVGLLEQCGRS
jgi:UDP-N-acetylglucosamine--N-acetylmuramyl-(pentapeptide) pyrophosphoryl-undecaprenol N-acetylglucosamine transferase